MAEPTLLLSVSASLRLADEAMPGAEQNDAVVCYQHRKAVLLGPGTELLARDYFT